MIRLVSAVTSDQMGEFRASSQEGDGDEVGHIGSTVSHSGTPSVSHDADVAPTAASLRAEIKQLEELLAARTQAWRSALRQRSEVQGSVAALVARPKLTRELEPMSSEDWDRLERS